MRTLIIISHPALKESHNQSFLKESLPAENITWHHLEEYYSNGKIDREVEQQLLLQHDRILFQFPLYWYSSPPLLKQWQDEVLTEGFAYGKMESKLKEKEFGLVISTGVHEREYQTGGKEEFTLSELTTPYRAMARKCQMKMMPIFLISMFDYMDEEERKTLLIKYRQYITKENSFTLLSQEKWFEKELKELGKNNMNEKNQQLIDTLISQMNENRESLNDLNWTLQEMQDLR